VPSFEICAVGLSCSLSLGCSSSVIGRGTGTTSAARARFEVHIADQVSGSGRDRNRRPVEMTLTNESNDLLWVNTLMRSATPPYFPRVSEVDLEITGPSGKVAFDCKVNTPFATEGSYRVLRPREGLTKTEELWCYGPLDEPGTYTGQARYLDGNPQAPPAPTGAVHLSEELVAVPFQFNVVPK